MCPVFIRRLSGLYPVVVRPSLSPCSASVSITAFRRIPSRLTHSEKILDSKFEAILNNLPAKQPRSRLEPYIELIIEMRKRGCTYREIAHVLKKDCGFKVRTSTVNDFVLARRESKAKRSVSISRTTATNKNMEGLTGTYKDTEDHKSTGWRQKAPEGIAMSIKELKDRPLKTSTKRVLFEYNPDEPLRLQRNQRTKE
jgi:hypothetical protein